MIRTVLAVLVAMVIPQDRKPASNVLFAIPQADSVALAQLPLVNLQSLRWQDDHFVSVGTNGLLIDSQSVKSCSKDS